MSRLLSSRIVTGVVTVLLIAVVAFVARGAVQDDPGSATAKTPRIPGVAALKAESSTGVDLAAAASDGVPDGASQIATARRRSVEVYASTRNRRGKRVRQRTFNGQRIPLTFLVRGTRKGWVHVDLPTRPNQSRGWVRRSDVSLTYTRLRIEVRSKAHRLRLLDGDRVVSDTRIALGEALSPTPPGRYYVTDKIRATDPKGFYGPFALGLSAHSTVYTSFEGGDGQVGIHGTNKPSVLGTDVSHGCIRVRNDVIRRLARRVPLGTPVLITR